MGMGAIPSAAPSVAVAGEMRRQHRLEAKEGRMRRVLLATAIAGSTSLGVAALGAAAPAYAVPNPHGNSCQGVEAGGGNTPGNAATSPGSVFNEPGIDSPQATSTPQNTGGKGGIAYNKAQLNNKVGAAAQYDTACFNTTKTGTGTPMQPAPSPTQIPNNSLDTRTDNGFISHTGNGTK
jgi:hypothetical protein